MSTEERLARLEMLLLYLLRKQQVTSAQLQVAISLSLSADASLPERAMRSLRADMDVSITEYQSLLASIGLSKVDNDLGELLNQIQAAAKSPQN
jgi:hypothetical protein